MPASGLAAACADFPQNSISTGAQPSDGAVTRLFPPMGCTQSAGVYVLEEALADKAALRTAVFAAFFAGVP